MKSYEELVKPYKDVALQSLAELVGINSVDDPNTKTAEKPFGEGVYKALDYLAKLGESLGFEVDRCDNYCTELATGQGKLIDIYSHADVVPVSNNWVHDPFKLTIEGDKMYGRGACDDKGPGISALFAAKALKDNGLLDPNVRLRIVFGGNEEKGSKCLEHYFHVLKKEYPTFGFTPDADFPLIYGEKSVCDYEVEYNVNLKTVKNFEFGKATNIVLDRVEVYCFSDEEIIKKNIKSYLKKYADTGIKIEYDDYKLTFIGKPCHGSIPWEGCNAGLHLLNFFGIMNNEKVLKNIYKYYHDGRGAAFGGDYSSEYFKDSSYCIGMMKYVEGKISFIVNMRLPENKNIDEVIEQVRKSTGCDNLTVKSRAEALLIDPNSYLVKTLTNVYREETGDNTTPIMAIGGGTYAKESKNTIAFGPTFPNREFYIHQDDEYFSIEDFMKCMAIYAHAIVELSKGAK